MKKRHGEIGRARCEGEGTRGRKRGYCLGGARAKERDLSCGGHKVGDLEIFGFVTQVDSEKRAR